MELYDDCKRGAPRELGTGPEAALPTCTPATVAVAVAVASWLFAAVGGFSRPCPSVSSVPSSATPTTATPAPCPDSAHAYFHAYFHDDHCPRGQVAPHIVPPPQEHRRDPERRVAQSHPPPEIALKSCIDRHTLYLIGTISSRTPFPFPFPIYLPALLHLTGLLTAGLLGSFVSWLLWDWTTWGLVMCMFPPHHCRCAERHLFSWYCFCLARFTFLHSGSGSFSLSLSSSPVLCSAVAVRLAEILSCCNPVFYLPFCPCIRRLFQA